MENLFEAYYRPSEEQFQHLWLEAIFVMDTSVLLNMYRYKQGTRDDLLNVLRELSEGIWLPHQVALEYQQKRIGVILDKDAEYDKLDKAMDDALGALSKGLDGMRHPSIDGEAIVNRAKGFFEGIRQELAPTREVYKVWVSEDPIRDELDTIYDGKVGKPYPEKQLREIMKLGAKRFEDQIPPGYKDAGKDNGNEYGDLIIWMQIIDEAKVRKKPVILVIDDVKEDWWYRVRGQTVGPRTELIEEMLRESGQAFYTYQTHSFLEHAKKLLTSHVSSAAIADAKDILEDRFKSLRLAQRQWAAFDEILTSMPQDPSFQESAKTAYLWGALAATDVEIASLLDEEASSDGARRAEILRRLRQLRQYRNSLVHFGPPLQAGARDEGPDSEDSQ